MRSSAALSALIRLCPTDSRIASFYYTAIKRIGNPSLALSLVGNETREAKCYSFLTTLARTCPGLSGSWRTTYEYGANCPIQRKASPADLKKALLEFVSAWRYVLSIKFITVSY